MIRNPVKTILLIENNLEDARLLREMLNGRGDDIEFMHVTCMSEFETRLAEQAFDIILVDLGLSDARGLEAVRRTHAAAPRTPLVVLTGLSDESLGPQALQEGAADFLVKGQIEPSGLLRALRYAIERKVMEGLLFAEKERAQVTLNCIGDAVICTDIGGNVTFLNAVAERLTGWPWQEAAARPVAEVLRIQDATSHETIPDRMAMAVEQNRTVYLPPNCILIRRDGFEVAIEDSASPIHDRDGQGDGAVIVFRDVSAARAMTLDLAHAAHHDVLTGLPNRALLIDRVGQAIAFALRHKHKVGMLFLDLDGFKHINDSLGHSIGDELLKAIAARLLECVRRTDTVSRQGGDEFVVLVSEVRQLEDIIILATRMLHAVAGPHSIANHDLHITTSIGVSVYPDDGLDAMTLIKNADTAMYQAKENGRQCYQFFTPAMNIRAVERQSLEEGLRRALERNEFSLHYQPKIDLKTGAITGAEALLRWRHATRGSVAPAEFIPVAEDCGLIVPIGAWVLREACRQAQAWIDAGLPMASMAVNISALEFRDANFLKNLFATLSETGLDPRFLELELTEGVLMKHADTAASVLQTLRERHVQVAIDDFGTGYSSLSYLRRFPVDELKIDQSFVRRIGARAADAPIVTAILAMARSLKLRVVAEGVETPEEHAFLKAHQCDEAQGYHFSRPLPPDEFAKLLRSGIPKPAYSPDPSAVSETANVEVREAAPHDGVRLNALLSAQMEQPKQLTQSKFRRRASRIPLDRSR
jgi:diguanylate cyclase (GGDEF)-like protein/PAS domain S-box-containing protein